MKAYVLYNPKAQSGKGETEAKKLSDIIKDKELFYYDITAIKSYEEFFNSINEKDEVIIAGGDGTLSRFASDTYAVNVKNPVMYYATGTGNDFLKDMNLEKGAPPVLVNEYIKNLPVATINNKSYPFINGIGFGIDGYACEIGDKMREAGKKINYISIVIKGILYAFKPKNAVVTVDGRKYSFKRVWFAPTMKGRFYGGGIMMAPKQDRREEKVSLVMIHSAFNLVLMPLLPSAFKGEHIKYTKYVTVMEGKDITVKFDKPSPLQVDGETIKDVTEYSVRTARENIQNVENMDIA